MDFFEAMAEEVGFFWEMAEEREIFEATTTRGVVESRESRELSLVETLCRSSPTR